MIVYGSSLSPYVRKVLAYAAERGIHVENQPTGIGEENPEFRAASPFGKMPALVDGDYMLADSSAIIHYLEAKFPDRPLIPAEAEARGKVVWFEEFADTILGGCGAKMFFNRVVSPVFLKKPGDLAAADAAEKEELPRLLDYLEGAVAGREYLVGNEITLADIAVASPLANLRLLKVAIDPERFPATVNFVERILSRPSFAPLVERETALMEKVGAR